MGGSFHGYVAMWLPAGLAEQQQGIGFREPILAGAEELRPRRGVGADGAPTKEEVTWEIETHQITSDNIILKHQFLKKKQNSQVRYRPYGRFSFLASNNIR